MALSGQVFAKCLMEPIQRKAPPRLRLSLAAYSLRQYLDSKAQSKQMSLFDFVDYCADLGLAGCELTSYYFPEACTNEYLTKLKMHCHRAGVSVSGGAIRNDFCSTNPVSIERDLKHTRDWIDRYALLGAPTIRIFAGDQQAGEDVKITAQRCAANCELACNYAATKGIMLALENHGGITATADGLLQIVTQVDSPAFGVNFDSGNFHGQDPYGELELIAPYAVNAQVKVEIQRSGQKVESDLQRVLAILRKVNYSGWVALEYESDEDPLVAIPKWVKRLKPLMDG